MNFISCFLGGHISPDRGDRLLFVSVSQCFSTPRTQLIPAKDMTSSLSLYTEEVAAGKAWKHVLVG